MFLESRGYDREDASTGWTNLAACAMDFLDKHVSNESKSSTNHRTLFCCRATGLINGRRGVCALESLAGSPMEHA